jgi:hypothetical protein
MFVQQERIVLPGIWAGSKVPEVFLSKRQLVSLAENDLTKEKGDRKD